MSKLKVSKPPCLQTIYMHSLKIKPMVELCCLPANNKRTFCHVWEMLLPRRVLGSFIRYWRSDNQRHTDGAGCIQKSVTDGSIGRAVWLVLEHCMHCEGHSIGEGVGVARPVTHDSARLEVEHLLARHRSIHKHPSVRNKYTEI